MRRAILLAAAVCVALAGWNTSGTAGDEKKASGATAKVGSPAPQFTLKDYAGNSHSLKNYKGKYVVLEWTNMDCPFVKKHYKSGNMQSLQKKYAKKGVVWFRICSSAPGTQGYFDAATIEKREKKDKAMDTAYLIDSEGKVGRMFGAKTTPHMFVIDPKGILIYAGGIDNKPSTSTADVQGATNYVDECLTAAMDGKPIKTKTATPYGCAVKYKKI